MQLSLNLYRCMHVRSLRHELANYIDNHWPTIGHLMELKYDVLWWMQFFQPTWWCAPVHWFAVWTAAWSLCQHSLCHLCWWSVRMHACHIGAITIYNFWWIVSRSPHTCNMTDRQNAPKYLSNILNRFGDSSWYTWYSKLFSLGASSLSVRNIT